MKRKKGFTLIELLAVIVILALIALIATPIILKVIEDAKKKAAIDSAYGYIEAVETNNALANITPDNYTKIESTEDVTTLKVKVKGTKPTSGTITIEKDRVKEANLCITNYNVYYNGNEAKINGKCGREESKEEVEEEVDDGINPVLAASTSPIFGITYYSAYNNIYFENGKNSTVSKYSLCDENSSDVCIKQKTDISASKDESVMAYVLSNGDLVIASKGVKNPIANENSSNLFYNINANSIDVSNLDTSNVTNMQSMFSSRNIKNIKGTEKMDLSNVVDMQFIFQNTSSLSNTTIDFSNKDVSKVKKIYNAFQESSADSIKLKNLNLENVENMGYLFIDSKSSIDLSGSKFKISDLNYNLFKNLTGETLNLSNTTWITQSERADRFLKDIHLISKSGKDPVLDVTNLKIPNITDTYGMFWNITGIKEIKGLNTIDVSNVTNFNETFKYLTTIETLNLNGWDTSKATYMTHMIYGDSNGGYMASLKSADLATITVPKSAYENDSAVYLIEGAPRLESLDISSIEFNSTYSPQKVMGTLPCGPISSGQPITITVKNATTVNQLRNGINGASSSICGDITHGVAPSNVTINAKN